MLSCLDHATLGFDVPLSRFITAAGEAGFAAVEFSILRALSLGQTMSIAGVRSLFASAGVQPAQFTCGTGLPANIAIPPTAFALGKSLFEFSCRLASELNCGRASVLLNPAKGSGLFADGCFLSPSEAAVRLRELAAIGNRHGIAVTAEICDRELAIHAGDIWLEAGMENLGLLIDTCQLAASGLGPDYLCRLPNGSVSWVHLGDSPALSPERLTYEQRVLPGDGALDLSGMLGAIATNGYRGYVSIEVPDPKLHRRSPETAARAAFASFERGGLDRWFAP